MLHQKKETETFNKKSLKHHINFDGLHQYARNSGTVSKVTITYRYKLPHMEKATKLEVSVTKGCCKIITLIITLAGHTPQDQHVK